MKEQISLRQYLILLVILLLPAVIKTTPGRQAEIAGRAAWLGVLAASAGAAAIVWAVCGAGKLLSAGAGMQELLSLAFGERGSRALCGLYGLWLVLLACLALRFCGDRFLSTIYLDTEPGLFFAAILWLVWWLGERPLIVTARTGQIYLYGILLTLAVVLALGSTDVKLYNVWPVWAEDFPAAVLAGGSALEILSMGMGTLFLLGRVTERRDGRRCALRWLMGLMAGMTLLAVVGLGIFGAETASRLEQPFFSIAKEESIRGVAERVEPLVVSTWVTADVIGIAVLLRSAREAVRRAAALPEGNWNGAAVLLLFPGAYLLSESDFALEGLYDRWIAAGNVVLFFVVPLLACLLGKLKKSGKRC